MSRSKDTRTKILETTWALLEANPGTNLSMSEIAKAAGVSRQALYLHFTSRAEVLIATTRYVDEVKGLNHRLQKVQACNTGIEMLQATIKMWGNYIPEIYSVSKALMVNKELDEASAAAWQEIMGCLHQFCVEVIHALKKENKLSPDWTQQRAADFLYTLISIHNWEQLTIECGWSNNQYVTHTTNAAMKTLVAN